MNRVAFAVLCIGIVSATGAATAQTPTQTPAAHRFIQVAPDVYAALGNGTIEPRDTAGVIINADDVLLVDTNITPEATRRLVNDIKTLTPKPIRYVVNTHWHYDHADGNQIFGPEVTIIGHENARTAILSGTPPTLTFENHLTVFRGDREIRLIHPGRGYSDTDVLVYLPKEKLIFTGDFFEGPVTGALNFGFHDEWANNLEKLKALDYETTIPGHGEPFKGKERIDDFQAFLRDLWNQTKALHEQKVPVADAAARVDMSAHTPHYQNLGATAGFPDATIARIYQVLDQRTGSN